ncbi:MAG: CRISPR-associated helicase/endonuclease Cas3, partial [Thiolinea sp.]
MGEAEAFYFRYWGKAKPCAEGGQPYHLLVYHSLDVAAVASVWWDQSLPIQDSFIQHAAGLSREQMKAWVIFFIALHDYGKFDIRFQRKAPEAWTLLQNNFVGSDELPTPHDCKTYDHGSAGIYWYINDYSEDVEQDLGEDWLLQIETLVEDKPDDLWLAWIKSVAGHHGYVYPPKTNPDEFKCKLSLCVSSEIKTQDQIARQQWFKELERIFLQPVGLSLEDKPPIPSPLLAGFCSVADWLGSRSDEVNFRYKADPVDDLGSDYFGQRCLEDAPRVLALSGINGTTKTFNGVSALLQGYKPRQLQTLVDQLPADPGLTIVEAPTGSGKTEMALAYAWRLITENHADSIVFAMPTQATANAMMPRLEKLATTLFEDHPNLILAHGHARFNADFLTLKETWKTAQGKDEAWVHCSEWLGQSRKRIFLGQIGVCTIDQVLVSVLPVKHRFVRGFGVGRSVLIVDEVHAYDAYMYGLLEAVLRDQYNAGGSSLLLSATLNKQLRGDLLATYGEPIESETDSLPYPLISWSNKKTVCSYTLPEEELPPERQVKIECSLNDDLLPDESLQERIIAAAEQGAQVAIICNLV